MKQPSNELDDLFKDAFLSDDELTPPLRVWASIDERLSQQQIDEVFQNALNAYEETPSSRVWNGVQKQLPISLALRRQLRSLSRVAAVLVAIMSLSLYFSKQNTSFDADSVAKVTAAPPSTPQETTNMPNISPIAEASPLTRANNKLPEAVEGEFVGKTNTDSVDVGVADILAMEDGLTGDANKINRILAPLEHLPLDAALAFNPSEYVKNQAFIEAQLLSLHYEDSSDLHIDVYPTLKIEDTEESENLQIAVFPTLRILNTYRNEE